jgi:acetyl esterase/lipase
MKLGAVGVAMLVGTVTMAASIAGADGDLFDVPVAASPVLDDRYPRASVGFGHDVESFPDLVYSIQPGFRPLRLDLYKPRRSAQSSAGFPLVVYVHGGGWQSGHTRHAGAFADWPAVLALLASKGYAVASIEYRLSNEATADSPVSKYLGCTPSTCASTVALASPVTHIDARDPPALLIHGEADKVIPVAQSRAFHAALRLRKVQAELMVIPAADHSFTGPDEAATRSASLAALSKTFAFIEVTLGGKRP